MKKYSIIYADPPWAYRTYSKKGQGRSAESHYPTMCIEDIKALPVGELAAKDCALFLWITFPCLLPAWGIGQGRMPKSASLLQRDTRSVLTPVCVRSFSVILKSIPKSRMKRGNALFGSWETFPA